MSTVCGRLLLHVALCGALAGATHVGEPSVIAHRTPGDAPLSLAVGAGSSVDPQMIVGYASGRTAELRVVSGRLRVVRETQAEGGILALLTFSAVGDEPAAVAASTTTGQVVCFRGAAREPAWRFQSPCEISSLAQTPDVDQDGTPEIVAGGAGQRVHLLSGRTGREIWTHRFESRGGNAYVTRLVCTPDPEHQEAANVAVWLWSGELALLDGVSGTPRWRKPIGAGFTDALAAAPDLNADGRPDLLVGGNDGIVRACSGADGAVLWSGQLQRPIRDVVVIRPERAARAPAEGPLAASQPADSAIAYACTAGGEVACFDLHPLKEAAQPRWTVDLGDVCRGVTPAADLDRDGAGEVIAWAENGVVAVLAARDGRCLLRWEAQDVVRAVSLLPGSDPRLVAALGVDGVTCVPLRAEDNAAQTPAASGVSAARDPTTAPGTNPVSAGARESAPWTAAEDPHAVILLYHDVLPEARYTYATSVDNFRAQMDVLVREQCVCVSLDQIADWIDGKSGLPARAVCITFDGQYQGQHTYAFPILRERGLFATSYITTDWIGTANHADWPQLRVMDAAGVLDVQNHTLNHPLLSRCAPAEVVRQLEGCNAAIRRHLHGKSARHHTYPSGDVNEQVRRLVREAGFRTATTVRGAPVRRSDDLMDLPRYTLTWNTPLERFRGWVTGAASEATPP